MKCSMCPNYEAGNSQRLRITIPSLGQTAWFCSLKCLKRYVADIPEDANLLPEPKMTPAPRAEGQKLTGCSQDDAPHNHVKGYCVYDVEDASEWEV